MSEERSLEEKAMNAILNAMKTAASYAGGETRTRPSVIEYATQAVKLFGAVRDLRIGAVDSLLARVGLGRRPSAMSPLVWFAAGAILGGGTALAFAPASGKELRRRLARFLDPTLTEAVAGDEAKKPITPRGMGADGSAHVV